ncbi:phosphate acetyltransferase [Boudabousia liubingyangii]|uniref:phosphate acetyltransferase n=1 Tax=Boudabousia liubingyangii TaxID=1921764 RepID=UPI0009398775|nr:phosphate acetyltransferase [Boudabousia liubingyangii]OKL46325.1 phosphate acetyltransferase [Boudabousia liubingyangii]
MPQSLSVLTVANVPARDAVIEGLKVLVQETGKNVKVLRTFGRDKVVSEMGTNPYAASYQEVRENSEAALSKIVETFRAQDEDFVLAAGSAYNYVAGWDEFGFNASVAANCDSPVLLVLSRTHGCPCKTTRAALETLESKGATLAGVLLTDAPDPAAQVAHLNEKLADLMLPIGAVGQLGDDVNANANALRAGFGDQLGRLLAARSTEITTPLQFQLNLVERARSQKTTIVLPEPDDDRILQATDQLLKLGVADIVLIGDENQVRNRAQELGLDIAAARVVSNHDHDLVEKYAEELAKLRAKKGMTIEKARETVQDVSFFGTMMVYFGDADGMVSGAAHTTAHTILPSFQTIKTAPGTSIVSSVFLMLMPKEVHVYGDCAVNPNPTPEQLADIAISSAQTAEAFGVKPRVAMISYSTLGSGSGPDVDAVVEATRIAKEKAPELVLDGPLQFDAAYDPKVAASKAPESPVAGQANVFIFPSLSVGNALYKAVQRTSGAVAVGPVLQGLAKPVNDLSRGALVEDIVNTVAITAVQAQAYKQA